MIRLYVNIIKFLIIFFYQLNYYIKNASSIILK